jgi:EAL domain-containing protein (putative c-di-GMP-specific phosphodiesterase class I)
MSSGFPATVAEVLARTGMDPTALVLEVTEDVVIEDSQRAMTVLGDLGGLGIRLALDDFGTGYSSLSYLRHLPVHILKIDRSFITDIGDSPEAGAIAASVTDLAHVLGLTVTAEGVETPTEADAVRAMGCECAQGYFYARPMPADGIDSHLNASPAEQTRRVLLGRSSTAES